MPKIPDTYHGWEAYGYLIGSFVYLIKHPHTYGLPIVLLLGGGILNEIQHYTGISVDVGGKAKGTTVEPSAYYESESFPSVPYVAVQDKTRSRTWRSENAIVIDKQFFDAFQDPRFVLFKKENEDEILVYYKPTRIGRWYPVRGNMFDPENYQPDSK